MLPRDSRRIGRVYCCSLLAFFHCAHIHILVSPSSEKRSRLSLQDQAQSPPSFNNPAETEPTAQNTTDSTHIGQCMNERTSRKHASTRPKPQAWSCQTPLSRSGYYLRSCTQANTKHTLVDNKLGRCTEQSRPRTVLVGVCNEVQLRVLPWTGRSRALSHHALL